MKKINIGIIGCGRISKKHFDALEKLEDYFNIVSICDNNTKKLLKINKLVEKYDNVDKMLDRDDLDIVSICTPSFLHSEQTIKSINKKKHVITEKPMALNYSDANSMIEAAKINKKKLFVVKQNRLNPTILKLKNAIENGRFGKIYFVQFNVFWTRPQSYYDMDDWRGKIKEDGGIFMNQASHYVDLVEWLFGKVEKVFSYMDNLQRKIETEDVGAVILKFKSGAIGNLNANVLTYPKNYEGSVTIIGEFGTVKIGGIALNEIKEWKFKDQVQTQDPFLENYKTNDVYGNGHYSFYHNVYNSLFSNQNFVSDGAEGIKSIKLLEAIYLSQKNNKEIYLDEI